MSRILLDHCVPKPLRRWLSGHEVRTCHEEGWDAFRNGEFIELPTNRLSLMPFLVPALQQALTGATPGSYHEISLP